MKCIHGLYFYLLMHTDSGSNLATCYDPCIPCYASLLGKLYNELCTEYNMHISNEFADISTEVYRCAARLGERLELTFVTTTST